MALLVFLSVFVIFLLPDFSLQQNIENFISKNNETSTTTIGPLKSRTLYDYQTRVVAYKDLIESKCLLEILNGGESQISKWVSNGSKSSISKGFLISNQLLSKRQTWRLAGQRITEFCKGFPTYLIKDVATEGQNADEVNLLNRRRKRSTRHYFQGRVRGQTQSQYLNFGKVDQPGKAEAESTIEGSKAVVSGNNGMGQAQSQTMPFGCEGCYGSGYTGSNGYDQEQTIEFGQGRPGQRIPGQISQEPPAKVTHQFGQIPEQFGGQPQTGQERGRPGQTLGGDGQIVGGPNQFGSRPGEYGDGSGQYGEGPGQYGGGSQFGAGPGQLGQGNGKTDLGAGRVGGVNGHFGANGHIGGGNGHIEGGNGHIGSGNGHGGGENGHVGGVNGHIGAGNGYIGGENGHVGGMNGHVGGANGHIGAGNGHVGGETGHVGGVNGHIGVGNGHIGGGNGHVGGMNGHTGGENGHIGGGNGHVGVGNGHVGVGNGHTGGEQGQIYTVNGEGIGGRPQQTITGQVPIDGGVGTVGGGGGTGGTQGQVERRPGQSTQAGQTPGPGSRPGGITGQGYGPTLVGHEQGRPGVYQEYGPTMTEHMGRPVQGQGVDVPGGSIQNGGAVSPPGRQTDQVTGQIIDLGGSIKRPTHYDGSFGGQLEGDYQSNRGHSGRFYGKFSGQYEANGHSYNGYQKPGITGGQPTYTGTDLQQSHRDNGLTTNGKPVTGFQPEYAGSPQPYQPGYDGQSYVQHPTISGTSSGAGPGYHGTTGYPTNYVERIPSQPLNGHDGLGGYGPQTQYGTPQSQNGFHGGVPSGSIQTGGQPSPPGNGRYNGIGTDLGQPGYNSQYVGLRPGIQGPGYQPGNGYQVPPQTQQTVQGRLPGYTGHNGVGPEQGQGIYVDQQGRVPPGGPNIYGTGPQQGGQGGYLVQPGVGYGPNTGIDGSLPQYTNQRPPSGTAGQRGNWPYVDGTQGFDDSDSQVQTSVQQTEDGTHAQAQAQGTYDGGTAQSQVSGVYSGSGSFSASAGSDDGKRGAQTQVAGGKDGAQSSAQGRGGLGKSQAEVILSSETGNTLSSAQSGGSNHGTQSQVQASEKGGMADAQANGAGSTSSQAQIGFTPYDENEGDNQTTPFRGGGTAGAQSGSYSGITQAQIQGKFQYGIKYTGAAQAGSGGTADARNQTIKPGPFKPIDISFNTVKSSPLKPSDAKFNTAQTEKSQTQKQTNFLQANKKIKDTALSSAEDTTVINYNEEDDEDAYDEDDYGETEKPVTRSIITQSSDNQRQHIILDPLEDLDATVHQSRGDFPAEGTILQPGQTIPGSPGFKIPSGFRGTVKSISNGRNTYAIGKHSQAQSVTLSPGSGRIIYKSPVYAVSSKTHFRNGQYGYGSGYTYQPAYQPVQYLLKNGKVLPNFVSVSKSETGSKNLYTGKKTPSVYYTQSSSCGIFTNHCVFNAGKKVCFPKVKTNPDGTIMGC